MSHRRRVYPEQLPLPLVFPPPPCYRQERGTAPEPSPFATGPVLKELRTLNRVSGPVKGPILADLLGKSERTARYYLRQLEAAGLVQRPAGPRSGWMVVRL